MAELTGIEKAVLECLGKITRQEASKASIETFDGWEIKAYDLKNGTIRIDCTVKK